MLELFLLGSPLLRLSGLEVRVKTRKALVLTTLLALEGPQSRDRLATLFWADADDAKNSLRNALSNLRETFGAHLIADRSSVRLEADVCDALEVLRGNETAVLEYRGALLDGVALPDAPEAEEWLLEMRRRVEENAIRTLEASGSLEALEKLAGLDGLNESAQRQWMLALANAGQRIRALEIFERFRSRLEAELGVAPTPETLALADGLRLAPSPPRVGRVPSLPLLLLESRLVGRVGEFQRLVAGFHGAAQRQPSVIVLSGEPGIGKTRLAQEFLNWTQARGATTLQSRAFEGGTLAYQSIADALRCVRGLEALLSPVWLAELSRLLPELLDIPNLPAPINDEALGRSRVFEAVSRVLGTLANRSTLVWFLDDAQWADAASLEVLSFVTRRAAFDALPVLFVVTVRAEKLSTLQPWLTSLQRELPLTSLEVTALSRDETARFLEGLGLPLEPLLDRLYAETGGQPLFLSETLRSLSETGALSSSGGAWRVNLERNLGVAPGVRAVIEARFSRLSVHARALLEAGAVLGQGFTLSDAIMVAQIDEDIEPLEELLCARVLVEVRGSPLEETRYTFSHDKLRETALEALSDARARHLHGNASRRVHGSAAQRAMHAFGARDWTNAARFSLEAADQATRAYAWRDVHVHLERARSLLVARPEGTTPGLGLTSQELGKLYGMLSHNMLTLGETDDEVQLQIAREVLQLAKELCDPQLEIEAMLFHDHALPFDEARSRALLNKAEVALREIGDEAGLFSIEIRRTAFDRLHPDTMQHAIAHLETLIPRAEALGRDQVSWVYAKLADFNQSHGQWQTAVRYWRQEIAMYQNDPINDNTAYRLENLGFSSTNSGDLSEALRANREAYRIKLEIDDNPSWIGMAGAYLSYPLVETLAFQEALELTRDAYAIRHDNVLRFAAEFAFARAHVLLEMNDPAQARAALLQVYTQFSGELAISSSFDMNFWVTPFSDFYESLLCTASALESDWVRAAHHARSALGHRQQSHNWRGLHAPRLRHWLEVEALVRDGDRANAELVVRGLETHVLEDEPLLVNTALARHALTASNLERATRLAQERGWALRSKWLEPKASPSKSRVK
jgi:DNA-binding SARP family transcriptional activator/tetratricopeptide (TPR) repeat protein